MFHLISDIRKQIINGGSRISHGGGGAVPATLGVGAPMPDAGALRRKRGVDPPLITLDFYVQS